MEHRFAAFQPGKAWTVLVESQGRAAVDLDPRAVGKGDRAMLTRGGLDHVPAARQVERGEGDDPDDCRGDRSAKPPATRHAPIDFSRIIRRGYKRRSGGQRIEIEVEARQCIVDFGMSRVLGKPVGKAVPIGKVGRALANDPVDRLGFARGHMVSRHRIAS